MKTSSEEQKEEFIWAVKNGEINRVTNMIQSKIIKVDEELRGRQPIHLAADYGQIDIIKYLLGLGVNVNVRDTYGITPLLAAIWEGHEGTVKMLIEQGADTSITSPDGAKLIDCAEKAGIKKLLTSA